MASAVGSGVSLCSADGEGEGTAAADGEGKALCAAVAAGDGAGETVPDAVQAQKTAAIINAAEKHSMLLICLCCASFLLCAFAVVITFKQGSNIKISAFDHGCVLIYAAVYAECACILIRCAVKANIVRLV